MGFEPTTSSLGSWHSTTELLPPFDRSISRRQRQIFQRLKPVPNPKHRLKLDPKVTADQRGHGVGVAIEEYTKTSVKDRAAAAKKLEQEVLGKGKLVRMPKRKAS